MYLYAEKSKRPWANVHWCICLQDNNFDVAHEQSHIYLSPSPHGLCQGTYCDASGLSFSKGMLSDFWSRGTAAYISRRLSAQTTVSLRLGGGVQTATIKSPIWRVIIISVPLLYTFPQPVPCPLGLPMLSTARCLPKMLKGKTSRKNVSYIDHMEWKIHVTALYWSCHMSSIEYQVIVWVLQIYRRKLDAT